MLFVCSMTRGVHEETCFVHMQGHEADQYPWWHRLQRVLSRSRRRYRIPKIRIHVVKCRCINLSSCYWHNAQISRYLNNSNLCVFLELIFKHYFGAILTALLPRLPNASHMSSLNLLEHAVYSMGLGPCWYLPLPANLTLRPLCYHCGLRCGVLACNCCPVPLTGA